jgi:hypothetical protein
MSQLPAWDDDEKMYDWLIVKLDEQLEADLNKGSKADHGKILKWLTSDGPAIQAAELDDNVTPLRERYPQIARFIHPVKNPKGKHRPSSRIGPNDFAVKAAAADAARIRKLWQTHFQKHNRRFGQKSAESFAADRWEVDLEDIHRLTKRQK